MKAQKRDNEIKISVENSTIIRAILLIFGAVIGFLILGQIIKPLILIVISFFLAIALNPAVTWISNKFKSKSRVAATGVAYLAVVGFLALFFTLVFPPIVTQIADFIKEVPETAQDIRNNNETVRRFVDDNDLDGQFNRLVNDYKSRFTDFGIPILSTVGKVGSTIVSTFVVLVLTFMMLVEGPYWLKKYLDTLDNKRRKRYSKNAKKMYRVIVGYANGQVLIAALGGLTATIMLMIVSRILGVEVNSVALGGLVAMFALLPMIGTTIGAFIVVLSTLITSWPLALIMAIFFIVYQRTKRSFSKTPAST